jgi:glycosyltransferase involved in cell wall biosynthesis
VNLAFLIGHFPPGRFGGAELQAEGWARRLSDRHQSPSITRRDLTEQPPRETRDGYEVVRLPVSRLPLWRTAADVAGITRAVGALAPRPDVLLCFQTFVSGLAGVHAGRRLGIPAVVWIRSGTEYQLDRSRTHRWIGPRVWEEAAAVLVQSPQNEMELIRQLERYAPARLAKVRRHLRVVANGIDLPDASPGGGTRVLTVGRLIPEKGVDVVIDAAAAARLPLTVVGEGPERAALEARARAADLDCRFEGYASRERLDALYREASSVVLAARDAEGLPNVLLEAMARSRPVIATSCAGVGDLITDGVTGLLVAPDAPGELAAALERLARDPELAERLGREARRAVERFGWPRVRQDLEQVLAQSAEA